MQADDIKINPKLLKPLNEMLDRMDEEKRMEYLDNLLMDVDKTIEDTQQYAKSKSVDYKTALRHVIITREPIIFRKDGC